MDDLNGSVLRSLAVAGHRVSLRDIQDEDLPLLDDLLDFRGDVDHHELIRVSLLLDLLRHWGPDEAPSWYPPAEDVFRSSHQPEILDREKAWLPPVAERYRGSYQLVIVEKSSGLPVGYAGTCLANAEGNMAFISMYLRPESMLTGYGVEAALLLFRQLFEVDGFSKVLSETDDVSLVAQASALNKFYKFETRRRHAGFWNGTYRDRILYSLSKSDWDSNTEKNRYFKILRQASSGESNESTIEGELGVGSRKSDGPRLRVASGRFLKGIESLFGEVAGSDQNFPGVTILHRLAMAPWPLACVWEDDGEVLAFMALGLGFFDAVEVSLIAVLAKEANTAPALREFTSLAFSIYPIERITHLCSPNATQNVESCMLAGFSDEGTIVREGSEEERSDYQILALLRSDVKQ